ncbi:MAG: DNA recombination protein RmuC [Opitutales bacterium]|jgi:DNA recombination protein RmuC
MEAAAFLLLGIVLGAIGALLWLRSRNTGDLAALRERVDNRDQRIAELERERAVTQATVAHAAGLEAELKKERESTTEKLALLADAEKKLREAFSSLSAEALRTNNQQFLELAKSTLEKHQETARGDLDKRQQAIDALVKPVSDTLGKFDSKLRDLETLREGAYQALRTQVSGLADTQEKLRLETGNLVKALRAPQVRGRWGEIQLKRVVELAGMLEHCDFQQQPTATTTDGRLRPDLVVKLPGGKNVVVDAKAPLAAYLEALEAPDEATRTEKLRAHARQIREHLRTLGQKSYWEQFPNAPEFVVLFLPGETFFSAALEQDPALIEEGVSQRVILATPTTLIALLKAVSYGWRQEALAVNAAEISDLGRELHERLATMGEHFTKLGDRLDKAVEAYNQSLTSLESRVLVTARRFTALGANSKTEIPTAEPVEKQARTLQAPELLGPAANE